MQKRLFRTINGQIVDVIDFCTKHCAAGTTLYVGTDSAVKGSETVFVTVVAVRFGNAKQQTAKGATFCYLKNRTERHKDKLLRLEDEAKYTMEIVKFIEDNYIPVDVVEFDYNSDDRWASNKVMWATGYATGLGYTVTVKPDEQVAVKAANHLLQ